MSRKLKAPRSWLGKDLGPQFAVFVAVAQQKVPIHLIIVCSAIGYGCAQFIRFFDAEVAEWPKIRLPVPGPNPRLIVANDSKAFFPDVMPGSGYTFSFGLFLFHAIQAMSLLFGPIRLIYRTGTQ